MKNRGPCGRKRFTFKPLRWLQIGRRGVGELNKKCNRSTEGKVSPEYALLLAGLALTGKRAQDLQSDP